MSSSNFRAGRSTNSNKPTARLGTKMKATGEVMAIDRNLEAALQKAVASLEPENIRNTFARTWRRIF